MDNPARMILFSRYRLTIFAACLGCIMAFPAMQANAGALRDKLMEHRQERQEQRADRAGGRADEQNDMADADATNTEAGSLPAGTRVLRDVSYGSDKRQSMDVYLPANASGQKDLPVILMVHGGAWKIGNKSARGVVENKAAHWLPKNYIFVSINYRMLPDIRPLEQAEDVARALAAAQAKAAEWGGSRQRFILMGHSAGAHLVALLSSSPALTTKAGVSPWLATIALDSAAYDINKIMEQRHYRFYDEAFGSDPGYWRASSPALQLQQASVPGAPWVPILAVCSSQRPDHPCLQAEAFVMKAKSLGMTAQLLPQALSHGDINKNLGQDNAYTAAVDKFLQGLAQSLP